MTEETNPQTVHVLTCHVPQCENFEIGIEFTMPYSWVVCGPCGTDITDIEPPIPEGRDEYLDRLHGFI